jgi:N-acetylglutamate synthase
MDLDHLRMIEEAALNAWPAPRQMLLDGWLLRFTGGHSKRVNSVTPLYPGTLTNAEKIATCESIYASQGQPCLFRICETQANADLVQALQKAGYAPFDPTCVLGRPLSIGATYHSDMTILEMPNDEWFRMRAQVTKVTAADQRAHESIINSIVPEKILVGLLVNGQPVACGMGVVEGELLGFFSIYTASRWRRKGFAGMVMSAISDWGMARAATYGYLQVEGDNHPALALYEKLGFETCYRYIYYGK